MSARDITIFLGGFLLLSVRTGSAQVLMKGPCPTVSVKTPFVPDQYVGVWFEIQRYFTVFEKHSKCVIAEYTAIDAELIGITNSDISKKKGVKSEIQGIANRVSATEAKYHVRFPNVIDYFSAQYWVLDTDYINYSVVWSCNEFDKFHFAYVWILARTRNPTDAAMANAFATLDKNKIERKYLLKTDQTNCPDLSPPPPPP